MESKVRTEFACAQCWKPASLCFCSEIEPVTSRLRLLILQHPQETRNPISTARLASLGIKPTVHRTGLSWGSLRAALKDDTANQKEWATLFLGTLKNGLEIPPDAPLSFVDKSGSIIPPPTLKGIILLDGTWKQSKTMWWRNPWLLKTHRIVLNPSIESAYNRFRHQPRKNCLSTIEAARDVLHGLGEITAANYLDTLFSRFTARLSEK